MATSEQVAAPSSRQRDPLLTLGQVAALIGVPPSTLRRWESEGNGPERVVLSRRTVRYQPEAVDRWLDARRRTGTAG